MRIVASTPVLVLWWVAVGLTVAVIVPLAVYLLHQTWQAARNIRRYTDEALEAGRGIAENAAAVGALDDTIETAIPIVDKAEALDEATGRLAALLADRASG